MTDSSRRLQTKEDFAERARTRHWSVFPVSPEPYYEGFRRVVGKGASDYRMCGLLVRMLHLEVDLHLFTARSDDERIAIHRAALGVAVDAIEGMREAWSLQMFAMEHERLYQELLDEHPERKTLLLPDLVELAATDRHGVLRGVEPYLATLSEPHADIALRHLADLLRELRVAGLRMEAARYLRRAVLASFAAASRSGDEHVETREADETGAHE